MKIMLAESPTLYFPSEIFTIGNWVGQVHSPSMYWTYKSLLIVTKNTNNR